ncbi:hypothetical protein GGR57DRAFT_503829 [Xylariaceae sp. FL1272]|nr:hypothetical protein GGR57DRAFT_503829 [Xylariaceae sp. FL1272]
MRGTIISLLAFGLPTLADDKPKQILDHNISRCGNACKTSTFHDLTDGRPDSANVLSGCWNIPGIADVNSQYGYKIFNSHADSDFVALSHTHPSGGQPCIFSARVIDDGVSGEDDYVIITNSDIHDLVEDSIQKRLGRLGREEDPHDDDRMVVGGDMHCSCDEKKHRIEWQITDGTVGVIPLPDEENYDLVPF